MSSGALIRTLGMFVLVCLLLLAPVYLNSVYWVSVLVIVGTNVLLASSLRTIILLDQVSLGHVGFMLIGAYASSLLMMKLGFSFWIALVLAGLLSGTVALALGYPFLRVKGIYFAMLTLLTAETFRLGAWNWRDLTGGYLGLVNIPAPEPLGPVAFDDVNNYYYLTLVVVAVSLFVLLRLEKSPIGFRWRAIRDAESLAQSLGINVMWHKIVNFAIACFFAGIAGALFAHYKQGLSADLNSRFGVMTSLYLVLYVVVGGHRRFSGPIIGAFVITMVSELARPLKEYQPMLIGAIAIFIALFFPEGIASIPERLRQWRGSIPAPVRVSRISLPDESAGLRRQPDSVRPIPPNSPRTSGD